MPTTADIQSLADVEALYGIEKGNTTMRVSTLARQLGLAEGATADEVTVRVRELAETAAVEAQTTALEYLLSLPSATMAALRREFHGDFDAAASAAKSRNLQPLVRS